MRVETQSAFPRRVLGFAEASTIPRAFGLGTASSHPFTHPAGPSPCLEWWPSSLPRSDFEGSHPLVRSAEDASRRLLQPTSCMCTRRTAAVPDLAGCPVRPHPSLSDAAPAREGSPRVRAPLTLRSQLRSRSPPRLAARSATAPRAPRRGAAPTAALSTACRTGDRSLALRVVSALAWIPRSAFTEGSKLHPSRQRWAGREPKRLPPTDRARLSPGPRAVRSVSPPTTEPQRVFIPRLGG